MGQDLDSLEAKIVYSFLFGLISYFIGAHSKVQPCCEAKLERKSDKLRKVSTQYRNDKHSLWPGTCKLFGKELKFLQLMFSCFSYAGTVKLRSNANDR